MNVKVILVGTHLRLVVTVRFRCVSFVGIWGFVTGGLVVIGVVVECAALVVVLDAKTCFDTITRLACGVAVTTGLFLERISFGGGGDEGRGVLSESDSDPLSESEPEIYRFSHRLDFFLA